MDKRYNELSMSEQIALRRRAIEETLGHPEWNLSESIRYLKKTMRLTTAELAQMAGVGFRTLQDIEQEVSPGTVQTMNKVLGVLGLKLGVVRARAAPVSHAPAPADE